VTRRGVPQASNRGKVIWRVHNRRGEARRKSWKRKIGGESDTNGDVVGNVSTTIILVREGVNVLVWSERRNTVVETVSVGGESVLRSRVKTAAGGEGS
jgi:hypothetical protein